MSEKSYQRNGNVILNRGKYYYENHKERLRERARDKCRNSKRKKEKERMWKKQIP